MANYKFRDRINQDKIGELRKCTRKIVSAENSGGQGPLRRGNDDVK